MQVDRRVVQVNHCSQKPLKGVGPAGVDDSNRKYHISANRTHSVTEAALYSSQFALDKHPMIS